MCVNLKTDAGVYLLSPLWALHSNAACRNNERKKCQVLFVPSNSLAPWDSSNKIWTRGSPATRVSTGCWESMHALSVFQYLQQRRDESFLLVTDSCQCAWFEYLGKAGRTNITGYQELKREERGLNYSSSELRKKFKLTIAYKEFLY
jgi:hypothetical protein